MLLGLALLPSCAGVSWTRDPEPLPTTIAILPLQGDADPRLRTLCRALLTSGLQQHGVLVLENDHTDRILAEHGWLLDPDRFDPAEVPAAAACAALGVEALLVGTGFDTTSFNILLLRRHAFGGALVLRRADGSSALRATGSVTHGGGLLLQSGQVLTELRAQGEHGTPREAAALVDAFVDDLLAALPPAESATPPADPTATIAAALSAIHLKATAHGDAMRLLVHGAVPPGTRVWLDLDAPISGVPASERDGAFSVARDVDGAPVAVRLRARDGFGRTASAEVVP